MAGRNEVGTAYVIIRGVTKDVKKDIMKSFKDSFKNVDKEANKHGRIAGRGWARGFKAGIREEGILGSLSNVWRDIENEASHSGRRAGERYAQAYNSAIKRSARRNRPTQDASTRQATSAAQAATARTNRIAQSDRAERRQQQQERARQAREEQASTKSTKSVTRVVRTVFQSVGEKSSIASMRIMTGLLKSIAVLAVGAMAALGGQAAIAGLAGIIGSLSQISGLLLTLPAAANAFALVLGTIKVGFSGIGSALQAAGQASQQSGAQAKAQAQQIESAQRGIETAIRGRDAAERSLEQAQKNRIRTQEQYTDAVKDATRQLQDYNLQLKGASLDEEDALIAVERAKERLANMPKDSTALDWREARNSLKQARLALEETRVSNKRLGEDAQEAFKKGVDGSDQVVAAREAIADADQAVIDAQQNLADATRAVADAQKQLADAMESSAGGVDAFAEAMSELSPNAQALVRTLLAVKEQFSSIKMTVQDNLLAGLSGDIQSLANNYFPVLNVAMGRMATTLNGVARDLLGAFNNPQTVAQFAIVMERVNAAMETMRPAFTHIFGAWKNLSIVGSEFLNRFAAGFTDGAKQLEAWTSDFGKIRQIIETAVTATVQWWTILKNLGTVIREVFSAATTQGFTEAIVDATAGYREFIEETSTQNSLADFFARGREAITVIGPVLENLTLLLVNIGSQLAGLGTMIAPGVSDFLAGLSEGVKNLEPGLKVIGPAINDLFSALGDVGPQLGDTISSLATTFSPWIDVMTILSKTLLPAFLVALEFLSPALATLSPLIVGLAIAWKTLRIASMAMNGVMAVSNVLLGKQATAAGAAAVQTKLLSAAQKTGSAVAAGASLAFGKLTGGLKAGAAAIRSWNIGAKLASATTKIWTAIQAAFNAVMMMNPFVLIVVGLAALVAGLVIAYKKSETFRNIVNGVWESVKNVIGGVWEWIKNTVLPGLQAVWNAISASAMWLWNNGIKPAWDGIKAAISVVWNVIKGYFNFWIGLYRTVGQAALWLWHNAIVPAFEAIKNVIIGMWDRAKGIFSSFKDGLQGLSDKAGQAKDWIVDRFNGIVNFFKELPGKIKSAAGNMWDGIKDSFKGMINGLIRMWNGLSDKLSFTVPDIPGVPKRGETFSPIPKINELRSGGVVNGPGTGTSDSVLGIGSDGVATARVSKGEFVVNEQSTKRYLPLLEFLNKMPRFRFGGLVGLANGGKVPAGGSGSSGGSGGAKKDLPANPMDLLGNIGNIGDIFANVGNIFNQVWATVIKPVIDGFGSAVQTLVGNVINPAIGVLTTTFNNFSALFNNIVTTVLQPMWDSFGATIHGVINGVINTAFETLKTALTAVQNFFGTTVQGITKLWDGLRKATGAPINWVIESAYNKGLTKVWNDIAGLVGMEGKKLQPVQSLSYATGGVLPGYTPGRDVHQFSSPTGGRLNLSGGEAIMRPEWTRAVGGPAGVNKINLAARTGKLNARGEGNYASGGVVSIGSYGLPAGSNISYGSGGFPVWVYRLARAHNVQASTYPGHQESHRNEAGYAPNPRGLNRGIDWSGAVGSMQKFAEYLLSVAPRTPTLEQIIWQNPGTGQKIGWTGRRPDVGGAYFAGDYAGHQDHVHSRHNGPLVPGLPGDARILGSLAGGSISIPSISEQVSESFEPFDKIMKDAPKSGGVFGQGAVALAKKAGEELKKFAKKKADEIDGAAGGVTLGALGGGAERNAKEIINSAKAKALGKDGSAIGVATGIVESGLRVLANPAVPASMNMPHEGIGRDHDSVGIFQQRQSGWGTLEQRMNPRASADMFFNAMLRKFPNWRQMDPGAVAQGVQVSAFPDKYGQAMGQARGIVAKLYDKGGWLPRGKRLVDNQTGEPEAVLTQDQWNTAKDSVEQVEEIRDTDKSTPSTGQVDPNIQEPETDMAEANRLANSRTDDGSQSSADQEKEERENRLRNSSGFSQERANLWLRDNKQDLQSQARGWGRDALKEIAGQFTEPFGLNGLSDMGIDQMFQQLEDQISRQEEARTKSEEEAKAKNEEQDQQIAETAQALDSAGATNSNNSDNQNSNNMNSNNQSDNSKLADTIVFNGVDPKKATEEMNRMQNQRKSYTSRYVTG